MASKKKIADLKKLFEERWNYPPTKKTKKIKYTACGKNARYGVNEESYEPCWKYPLATSPNIQFGPCWDYPPERYKRRPLPPPCRGAALPLMASFEKCETIYTRFDYELERCVHEQILIIEQKFINLEHQLSAAKKLQIEMTELMRYHAIRYQLLTGSACSTKIYPEFLSKMAEERALCEYQKANDAINQNNAELASYILDVQDSMPELQKRLDKLDRSLHSPFLEDLDTVLETINNLSNYFFGVACKLRIWAQLMVPGDEHSIDDYLAILKMEQDFNTFMKAGTENCTCKRCNKKNPLVPFVPCWCQPRNCESSLKRKTTRDYVCNFPIEIRPNAADSDIVDVAVSPSKFQTQRSQDSASSTKT